MPTAAALLHERRDLLLKRGVYRIDTAREAYRVFLFVTQKGAMWVHTIHVDAWLGGEIEEELAAHLAAADPCPGPVVHRRIETVPANVLAYLIATDRVDAATVLMPAAASSSSPAPSGQADGRVLPLTSRETSREATHPSRPPRRRV